MKRYNVFISDVAKSDIDSLTGYIANELKSPITALRYSNGIMLLIKKLETAPDSYPISSEASILKYGYNARRLNFKSHSIIYNVFGNNVLIERVITSSMITL